MDSQTFSRELCAWIDPLEIIKAGQRYDIDTQKVTAPVSVSFTSPFLSSAEDIVLYDLVVEFLHNFRIPFEILELLQSRTDQTDELSDCALNWLKHLKFEGSVYQVNNEAGHFPEDTILMVEERDIVANIITQPIRVLVNQIGYLSDTWKQLKQKNLKGTFLLHSWPDSLGVYIESRIVQYYGFKDADIAGFQYESTFNNRYRAVTIVGTPPINQKLMEAAKYLAYSLGSETLKSI
jgi:hypothetical protein